MGGVRHKKGSRRKDRKRNQRKIDVSAVEEAQRVLSLSLSLSRTHTHSLITHLQGQRASALISEQPNDTLFIVDRKADDISLVPRMISIFSLPEIFVGPSCLSFLLSFVILMGLIRFS